MKRLLIYGCGGFAREVAWLVEEINQKGKIWDIQGFLDDNSSNWGKIINGYEVLGSDEFLDNVKEEVYIAIAIGNPIIKEKVFNKLNKRDIIKYPILIHPNVVKSKYVKIGRGTIICAGTILTTNIDIGEHVIINLDTTIGHDAIIKDFSTILPSVNVSGGVIIGEKVSIGTGSAIIQNINIGEKTTIGAGAVVVKSLPSNCTAVGVPAKPINKSDVMGY